MHLLHAGRFSSVNLSSTQSPLLRQLLRSRLTYRSRFLSKPIAASMAASNMVTEVSELTLDPSTAAQFPLLATSAIPSQREAPIPIWRPRTWCKERGLGLGGEQ
jgi:hypothetical protein